MPTDSLLDVLRYNWPQYFMLPWLILVFAAIVALAFVPGANCVARGIGRTLHFLGDHGSPWRGPLVVFTFALVWGAFPSLVGRRVLPVVHDEISYLLAADTFRHGRVSNPTPPCWESFQTLHELMRPSYASKFPPGQGLALAAGGLLGSERIGAYGVIALAAAAVCWMLRAVVAPRRAVAGGLLAATHPLTNEWAQSFWGGGVAMLGAALLCGAALRVARLLKPSRRTSQLRSLARGRARIPIAHGIVMGVGIAILLNSRPLEGTILCALVGSWLLTRSISAGWAANLLLRTTLPAAITLVPALAWMAYYNYRVTGHPLVMPYVEHARQYMSAPIFWWQGEQPAKDSGVDRLNSFHQVFEVAEWRSQRTLSGFVTALVRKVMFITRDFGMPTATGLVVLLGGALAVYRRATARLAIACCVATFLVHLCLTPWLRTQYLSVIVPAFLLLLTVSLRELRTLAPRRRVGRALPIAALIGLLVVQSTFDVVRLWTVTSDKKSSASVRESLVRHLESRGGKHLVYVAYEPGEQRLYEWVFNSAEIDEQRVVFVRFLGTTQDQTVFESFRDRQPWLLSVSLNGYRLEEVPVGPNARTR